MSGGRPWSDDEILRLRELFKTKKSTREIAELLGRSIHATQVKAHHLGIRKNPNYRIDLTDEQKRWLRLNYPHMRTEICAMMLGISLRTCVRKARELGVDKTPQFMKECQAFTSRKAKESHLRNGTYPPKGFIIPGSVEHRFKPGHKSTRKRNPNEN